MSYARTCYDHLAGVLGVQLYAAFLARELIEHRDGHPMITAAGDRQFTELGIDTRLRSKQHRPLTRQCLDWTQRRHHLGGALGAALLDTMLAAKWLEPGRDRRVIKITTTGTESFERHFGMVPAPG